ncbi:hypothetical protein CPC08DRAFT_821674 [Agrocybe pediades]|nr:hypothetical protein CPC08DRAFT_821674 [Agrocybe pediades]
MVHSSESTSVRTQAPLPALNLMSTLGSLLVGVLIACFLFGIITVQAFTFYTRFPHDKLWLKLIVVVLCLCEVGHSILTLNGTYLMIVSVFGNVKGLVNLPRVLIVSIAFNAIIAPVVQLFFANRVRIVGKKLFIPIICSTLSLARTALIFVVLFKALKAVSLSDTVVEVRQVLPSLLGVGAGVDLILTATMVYYIAKRKRSALILDTTLLWTIQTGFASFICGIVMLVAFLAVPDTFIWLGTEAVFGRTFTCALLASLNGRTKTDDRSRSVVELRPLNRGRNARTKEDRFIDTASASEDKVKSHHSPCAVGHDAVDTSSAKGEHHLG